MHFSDKGYVLHQWKVKETSSILSIFTKDHGKISASAPKLFSKKSKSRTSFSLFFPLNFEFKRKFSHNLLTILIANSASLPIETISMQLKIAGLYINELLFKLLEQETPYPRLYEEYTQFFSVSNKTFPIQTRVREFEWKLLDSLGYKIYFPKQLKLEEPYVFNPELGEIFIAKNLDELRIIDPDNIKLVYFSGDIAQKIKNNDFSCAKTRKISKILFLRQLQWHTSLKELHSFNIFSQWKNTNES